MKTIKKWLLSYQESQALTIKELEVNRHIPINRFLDQVGLYAFDIFEVNETQYLCVYDSNEPKQAQTKILVSKICKENSSEGLTDLTNEDKPNIEKVAGFYLKKAPAFIA